MIKMAEETNQYCPKCNVPLQKEGDMIYCPKCYFSPGEETGSEEWIEMETKLVKYSVIGGIIALIVLAYLVNTFILGGF